MEVKIGENKILTQISSEPYWIICQAESKPSGERVWFKLLSQDLNSDNELVERFHECANVCATLRHPNILECYEHGMEEGLHFIAIEHFEGVRLLDLINSEKRLSHERAIHIVSQIAKALQHAHIRGILHGALSPHSVYLDDNDFVKIINFGSSRLIEYLLHSRADKSAVKLARYISPEQTVANSHLDGRSDIYSLGIIFYEMITGELPFVRKSLRSFLKAHRETAAPAPRALVPNLPEHIDNIILKQLEKDPDERFSNCTSLLYELLPEYREEVLEESDNESYQISLGSKIALWISEKIPHQLRIFSPTLVGSKRRITLAFFSILLLLAVIVLVVLLSGLGSHTSEQDMYDYLTYVSEENADQNPDMETEDTTNKIKSETKNTNQKSTEVDDSNSRFKTSRTESQISPPLGVAQRSETQRQQNRDPERIDIERTQSSDIQPFSPLVPTLGDTKALTYGTLIVYTTTDSLPTSASVYLNDELVGKTSSQGPLRILQVASEQAHSLRIVKPNYWEVEDTISVQANEEHSVSFVMNPKAEAMKRFYFRSVSFADRIIINNQLPSWPLPHEADLPVGKHTLRYINEKNTFSWDKEVFLDIDSPEEIFFDSKEIGYGILSVVIRNAAQFGWAYAQLDGENVLNKSTPYRARVPIGRHSVRVTREGFGSLPTDTTVFVQLGQETTVVFELRPQ